MRDRLSRALSGFCHTPGRLYALCSCGPFPALLSETESVCRHLAVAGFAGAFLRLVRSGEVDTLGATIRVVAELAG